jgi:hypothetical protein
MRISESTLNTLRDAIAPLDTTERRERYHLAGDFPRANVVKDLDKRYRWDLFWEAGCLYVLSDEPGRMPTDLSDAHIDTALRRIVAPLES